MPEIPEKVKTYLWVVTLTVLGALLQLGINRLGGTVTVPAPPTTIQVAPIDSDLGTVLVVRSPDGNMKATLFPKNQHAVISPESMFPESNLKGK